MLRDLDGRFLATGSRFGQIFLPSFYDTGTVEQLIILIHVSTGTTAQTGPCLSFVVVLSVPIFLPTVSGYQRLLVLSYYVLYNTPAFVCLPVHHPSFPIDIYQPHQTPSASILILPYSFPNNSQKPITSQ